MKRAPGPFGVQKHTQVGSFRLDSCTEWNQNRTRSSYNRRRGIMTHQTPGPVGSHAHYRTRWAQPAFDVPSSYDGWPLAASLSPSPCLLPPEGIKGGPPPGGVRTCSEEATGRGHHRRSSHGRARLSACVSGPIPKRRAAHSSGQQWLDGRASTDRCLSFSHRESRKKKLTGTRPKAGVILERGDCEFEGI